MRATKLLLASIALWLSLFAAPSFAAITQIFGTGTGGNVGSNWSNTAVLTNVATFNVSIPAGAYVVIVAGLRNNGTCSSTVPVDSKGNSYALIGTDQQSGSGVYHFATFLTTPIVSGDFVTLTCSTTASKGMVIGAWSGVWTTTPHDATVGNSGGTTATSASPGFGPTAALPCNGSTANCNLVVMGVSSAGNQIYTATDSQLLYMGCGSGTSPSPCMFSRISSSTAALTVSGNTLNTGASAWANRFDTFNGDGNPLLANKRLLFRSVP